VAVCAANAISHEVFPSGKVHAIDRSTLPTAEQTLSLIRKRRSNRVFSSQPIPEDYFAQILDAANRAPTASNLQLVEYTLITDPEMLNRITEFTLDAFTSSLKLVDNAVLRPIFSRLFPYLFR
jgi:nitroreductase